MMQMRYIHTFLLAPSIVDTGLVLLQLLHQGKERHASSSIRTGRQMDRCTRRLVGYTELMGVDAAQVQAVVQILQGEVY